MSKSKPKMEVTEYRMSTHFGICHGPLDYISEIIINEKVAWSGKRAAQGDILIDKPELFGGIKKEGGAVGTATYLPGGPTQVIPEKLAAKLGLSSATMPAYRGIASLWFAENNGAEHKGFYWTANSPYLPGVWVKASRASVGLTGSLARIWRGVGENAAVYIALDTSGSMAGTRLTSMKQAVTALLTNLRDNGGTGIDIRMVSWSASAKSSIERRNITADGYNSLISWVAGLTTSGGTDFNAAVSQASTFFGGSGDKSRIVVFVTDGLPEPTSTASAAVATLDGISNVSVYGFNIDLSDTTYTAMLDNTPADGVPVVSGGDPDALQSALQSVLGREFDSNAAHIIYECLTNTEWGMGATASAIDVASFEYAAQVLYGESFGLSMIWTRQTTIESFVSEVIDHIEATLFVSPLTGLLTLELIRDDYDIETLPVFTPDNSVVTNFARKLWGETINEIVVTYTNPENEEEETVVAQDLANIEAQGGIVSDGRNYYGVRTKSLAMKLAQRDLRAAATPLASCDIEVNRTGWNLLPGDVCILNSPEDGIDSIVMRVGPVDYGKPGASTVKASLVEDVFSLPLAEYTVPPDTEWQDTSEEPRAADNTLILTLPYYMVVSEVDPTVSADAEYPEVFAGVLASQTGQDTAEFDLYGEVVGAGGHVSIEDLGTKTIASRATLPSAINAEAQTVILSFPDRTQGAGPTIGGFMLIEGTDETDSELCLITAFDGSGYTFRRGVLDTVPRAWPAGTPVWFITESMVFADETIRSEAETVEYQIRPRTSLGLLPLADAPVVSETLTARPHLPSRPANVKVNGVGFGVVDAIGTDVIVTFVTRNRLTEDSQVLSWTAAGVTPEAGQTAVIELYDDDTNTLLKTYSAVTSPFVVPPADYAGYALIRVKVLAERDGYRSLQGYEIAAMVGVPAPVNLTLPVIGLV